MSVTLLQAVGALSEVIDDSISGTTDADGNTGKTTLIDSALSKYGDGYFGDPDSNVEWWVYLTLGGTAQLRTIKNSISDGVLEVHTAFSGQVVTSTAYTLHRFDRVKKTTAINQALYDCYPWFYKELEDDSTLTGTGSSDNEYEVPSAFTDFPTRIIIQELDGSEYELGELRDYYVKGTNFYADIDVGDTIVLIGQTYLSQFTNDASTTELSLAQLRVVSLLAASNLYKMLANVVNASDAGRYDALSARLLAEYDKRKLAMGMPFHLPRNVQNWE